MSRLHKMTSAMGFLLVILTCSFVFAAQPLLKQGMRGDDVLQIQAKLKEIGYLEAADGTFDEATRLAVLNFQLDAGLDPDGVIGDRTREALREQKIVAVNRGTIDNRLTAEVISSAKKFVGVPYVWAGASPGGFDCSGFVYYLYSRVGITLPRMADGQFEIGLPIKRNELRPGDLVFFSTYEPGPSHCGIYIGNNYFIHASSGAGEVTITPLSKPYYVERYLGARRVLR